MDWDDAYANAKYIPYGENYPKRWRADADAFRQKMSVLGRARLGVMYGHGTREVVDVFLPDGIPKGLMVFVHGGYWVRFEGSLWSHFAQGALERGWVVAMPTYDLCPRVRIPDITLQVAQAISVIAREFDGPIRLAGHSAGGHLVSRMLDPGVLPQDVLSRIETCVPISPVSDLRPLMNTLMNRDFRLDDAMAKAESPIFQQKPTVPVTVWVGAEERPVFLDQAQWLADAWGCAHVVDPGKHHFDVIDGLQDADSRLMSAILGSAS
ncbi:alpha/beta hydrolase [Marivita hallyeonensis]|uniref:Alpha/beta hydrolase fold n=1 Tax=Marivita hallyeonensis TaxID=996342 RepID=A0A1M5TY53_9RHOB|nr:alpha/beta hydrolase [Marivita hallyeonensis]SHH55717.1 alpha/beta hydrolase fold [Marivita hallyeonensis]